MDEWLTDELVAIVRAEWNRRLTPATSGRIDEEQARLALRAAVESGALVPRSRLEQVTTVAETYGFDPDDEPYIPLYRILPAPEGAESQ